MVRPRIVIVSPAAAADNSGNWHTAARWQHCLQPVAQAEVLQRWRGEPADALIALHARRSAASIEAFHAAHPERPIALVLTGTDVYRDIDTDASARRSLELASHLVLLQPQALQRLDAVQRAKARVIVQSAPQPPHAPPAGTRGTEPVFVAVGHLRAEKDPLTLMVAARQLGPAPGLRIVHIGTALDPALGDAARRTMAACPHYRWLGGLPQPEAQAAIAGASALVHMSRVEGGAHVVIEAVRAGVPVIASRIDGNIGLLGADYAGYFPVGDAHALAQAMQRFVHDAGWAARLRAQCAVREPQFRPEREAAAVRELVARMLSPAVSGTGKPQPLTG